MPNILLIIAMLCVCLVHANVSAYPKDEVQVLADVLTVVKHSAARKDLKDTELTEGMLKGMLQAVDPHSEYFTKEEYNRLNDSIKGKFFGIGVYIDIQDGVLHISGTIKGMPSEKVGLHNGDYITHIDEVSTFGLSLTECSDRLKGKKGSKVKIKVLRKNVKEHLNFVVTRAEIDIKSVVMKNIDDFLYIGITYFTEDTYQELLKGLSKYKSYKGIILDLRSNPGGLLDGAIAISSLFVNKDCKIFQYLSPADRGRTIHEEKCVGYQKICRNILFENNDEYVAVINKDEPMIKNIPLVVLVNRYSASASEIIALALQENGRGLVIGQKTFGKGSVQSVLPLKNGERGAIKLTTALYYSPKGNIVQTNGVNPDIVIPEFEAKSIEKGVDFLPSKEMDYKNHIQVPDDIPAKLQENLVTIEDFALHVGISSLKTSIVNNADKN